MDVTHGVIALFNWRESGVREKNDCQGFLSSGVLGEAGTWMNETD